MRKNKLLVVLLLPFLLLLPFGNFTKAQVPSYVGVEEGDEYTWNAQVNFAGVDTLVNNIRDVLVDFQTNLPSLDLFGLESLTINEIIEQVADIYLSNILPVGWQDLNISTLIEMTIEDFIENFNSTILSGMIPSNWQALNFTDFYDLVVDGINATLPAGWEDDPLPELFAMLINELNSTIFYGLIPEEWEDFTLGELFDNVLMTYIPEVGESFVVHMMADSLFSMGLPPGFADLSLSELLDELIATLPPEISGLNATVLFEQLFLSLNVTMPGGLESVNMSVAIDFLNMMINSTLPPGFDIANMTEILEFGINELVNVSIPMELQGLTIIEILDLSITEMLNMFDTEILPGWTETYTMLQAYGLLSYQVGLKVVINDIGSEIESYPGGPSGVPIDMDVFISLDFVNWMNLSAMIFGDLDVIEVLAFFPIPLVGSPLITPLLVDPSSYSIVDTALADQFMFTGALIVANNYDWSTIQTDMTIATAGNPDCIEMSVNWNSNGLLQSATVHSDGRVVVSLKLTGVEEEIPGFEIPVIFGVACFTIIAIIFYRRRKYKNII
ncbi:MAG: hypothetical protein ACFFA0_02105 [Promethearchaeota archaeon]